ncbi:olfactory receptor 477-like [Crotalus tigris]|uniref:olfactory receptor 477-like n=1 Tax=Crotalus tigris TaxID=88082 RepID=UPI00192F77BD|nr:olfactory receptor 477-like [Crotalus tigris]
MLVTLVEADHMISSFMKAEEHPGKEERQMAMIEAKNFTSVKEFILLGLTSDRKIQLLLFVVILIFYLTTVLGNLLIIILVESDIQLNTPMYYFLSHLAVIEICYVTSTMPIMLSHLMAGNGAISFPLCITQIFVSGSMATTESFLLGVMAYDRYLAICFPLIYTVVMDQRCQLQFALACWIIAPLLCAVCDAFLVSQPYCGPNHVNHFMCEIPAVLKLSCGDTQLVENIVSGAGALLLLLPLCVILTSYVFILYSVFHMKSTVGQRKALYTCGSHLLVVTFFYGPSLYIYIIPKSISAPDHNKHSAIFYILVTPLLNPIIYTLRNKDIHRSIRKILQRKDFEQKT